MNGTPIPYLLMNDTWVGILLLLCLAQSYYIFSHNHFLLWEELKNSFSSIPRQSSEIQIQATSSEVRYFLLLELQVCLLMALLFMMYMQQHTPSPEYTSPLSLVHLSIFSGILFLCFSIRTIAYLLIGWIFFDRKTTNSWVRCHFVTEILAALIFLPAIMAGIYLNMDADQCILIVAILLILLKSLLFFKGIHLFLFNTFSKLYFIVYLCTLEILPLLIAIKGLLIVNDVLQLNLLKL